MKLRLRSTAAALVTVAGTVGVAGCSVFSPAPVLQPYQPSDGTGTSVGGVVVRNVLVVSAGVDQPGVVSAVLVNSSPEDATVTVSADVAAGEAPAQSFFVASGRTLHLGDPAADEEANAESGASTAGPTQQSGWLQIPQVTAVPGETLPLTFRASGASAQLEAPVVLPCFEYAAITPTPAAPAATASSSPATEEVACGPATAAVPGGAEEE